ncbi:MAG TPA: PadR family transcriptional regulator [Candidatus Caccenecus avistercoris]|nr:PadR family transcriptional regulator [Candidatus Caccenecus avistercoris]
MNTQFKKGVLELLILVMVEKKDMYGYELVEKVSKVVDVSEGTIYPILKRLTNEGYFEAYTKESTEGPIRKYYHITSSGLEVMQKELIEWRKFSKSVNDFIERSTKND